MERAMSLSTLRRGVTSIGEQLEKTDSLTQQRAACIALWRPSLRRAGLGPRCRTEPLLRLDGLGLQGKKESALSAISSIGKLTEILPPFDESEHSSIRRSAEIGAEQ